MSGWHPEYRPRRAAERPPAVPPQFRESPSQREYPPRDYQLAPLAARHGRPPEPPRRGPHHGLAALAWGSATVLGAIALAIALRNHPGSGSTAATASAHAAVKASPSRHAAVKPAPSPSCTRTATFDYLVRTVRPGAHTSAVEIGNVDYADCTGALADFAALAGQADGECTTIALARDNPGYNVNETPARPLQDVLEAAGPGCRKAAARPRPHRPPALRGSRSPRPSPAADPTATTPALTPTSTPGSPRPTAPSRSCAPIFCPSGQPIVW